VPPGATVVLEGQTLKERTPLVLPPMEAGSYSVVVTREGYQELRTTVEVPVTGTASPGLLRLVPVAPKPVPAHAPRGETVAPERSGEAADSAPVRLRVETEPADAVVFVDGQRQGASPVVVAAQTGKDVAVRVEASKHQSLARTVKVGAGPEQVERFVLEPESRAAVPAGTSSRERAGRPESRSEGRMARVRFAVQPWAEVTCGGKRLGETPFEAVELRVGTYDCRFFNPDLKKTLSRRIEVKPIDLNVVSVKFE
ncbi:PEGA domain-containing protein, partial [Pyxidicoccus sp. 3LG]